MASNVVYIEPINDAVEKTVNRLTAARPRRRITEEEPH
jgi:hypothetical protein